MFIFYILKKKSFKSDVVIIAGINLTYDETKLGHFKDLFKYDFMGKEVYILVGLEY